MLTDFSPPCRRILAERLTWCGVSVKPEIELRYEEGSCTVTTIMRTYTKAYEYRVLTASCHVRIFPAQHPTDCIRAVFKNNQRLSRGRLPCDDEASPATIIINCGCVCLNWLHPTSYLRCYSQQYQWPCTFIPDRSLEH